MPLKFSLFDALLQWSRRVNTAECRVRTLCLDQRQAASMEPPCEHGGVLKRGAMRAPTRTRFNGAAV